MRRPVSRHTTVTRWTLATLAFVGVGLVELRFGHGPALAALLLLLVAIFFLGGSGATSDGSSEGADGASDSGQDGATNE